MKIVFMGTSDFAVPALEALHHSAHEIGFVVTQPDRPKNRGKKLQCSPIKEKAIELGYEVLQPERIRKADDVQKRIAEYGADICVVAAYGQIIPEEMLRVPRYGYLNIHGSILPKYRGAAPMQRAIEDGEEETGVTIMQMAAGLDTGDMLKIGRLPIGDMNILQLTEKLSELGGKLLIETLDDIELNKISPVKQDDSLSTYAAMITKEEGRVDFSLSARTIESKIRAFYGWPCVYTSFEGKGLKIWAADVVTGEELEKLLSAKGKSSDLDLQAGEVAYRDKKHLIIACGKDFISLREVQAEGRKRLNIEAFLLGSNIEEGDILK